MSGGEASGRGSKEMIYRFIRPWKHVCEREPSEKANCCKVDFVYPFYRISHCFSSISHCTHGTTHMSQPVLSFARSLKYTERYPRINQKWTSAATTAPSNMLSLSFSFSHILDHSIVTHRVTKVIEASCICVISKRCERAIVQVA